MPSLSEAHRSSARSKSPRPSGGLCWGRGYWGGARGGCWPWSPLSLCSAVSPPFLVGLLGLEGANGLRPWRRTGSCGGSGGCNLSMRHRSKVRGRFRPGLQWRPRMSAADLRYPWSRVEEGAQALLLGISLASTAHAFPPASLANLGRLLLTQAAMTVVARGKDRLREWLSSWSIMGHLDFVGSLTPLNNTRIHEFLAPSLPFGTVLACRFRVAGLGSG